MSAADLGIRLDAVTAVYLVYPVIMVGPLHGDRIIGRGQIGDNDFGIFRELIIIGSSLIIGILEGLGGFFLWRWPSSTGTLPRWCMGTGLYDLSARQLCQCASMAHLSLP